MEHLVYLMHVDWNWIKQRPQFLAEGLSRYFDVTVVQRHKYRREALVNNSRRDVGLIELARVPTRGERLRPLVALNYALHRRALRSIIRENDTRIVWVCGPLMYDCVPRDYEGVVVYDCMDDHAGLSRPELRPDVVRAERQLVERADVIFVSAQYLMRKLEDRYGRAVTEKMSLLRNGFDGNVVSEAPSSENPEVRHDGVRIGYFGTIGKWMDFRLIEESLRRIDSLRYKIIGPTDHGVQLLRHPRIEYTGPIPHESLLGATTSCDALAMPFVPNEAIKSVDPVKLYEYVNIGKDIICVRYPEVERFDPFAYLYEGTDEYCAVIEKLANGVPRKYSEGKRAQLLAESTWECRAKLADEVIRSYLTL